LIGKWARYCLPNYKGTTFYGKWAKIKSYKVVRGQEKRNGIHLCLEYNPFFYDYDEYHETCFDLNDLRNTNPDAPIEKTIAFEYNRWKSGNFVRVVNGEGIEVKQLTEFDLVPECKPLVGVVKGMFSQYYINGIYAYMDQFQSKSLRLVILETQ
jgi:hypothetical protein